MWVAAPTYIQQSSSSIDSLYILHDTPCTCPVCPYPCYSLSPRPQSNTPHNPTRSSLGLNAPPVGGSPLFSARTEPVDGMVGGGERSTDDSNVQHSDKGAHGVREGIRRTELVHRGTAVRRTRRAVGVQDAGILEEAGHKFRPGKPAECCRICEISETGNATFAVQGAGAAGFWGRYCRVNAQVKVIKTPARRQLRLNPTLLDLFPIELDASHDTFRRQSVSVAPFASRLCSDRYCRRRKRIDDGKWKPQRCARLNEVC